MAGPGGARKGVGRPRNATKHKTTAATLTELCAGFAPQALAKLVELANGYQGEPPDRVACIYIIDRVLGKPRQAVELAGKDGGAIPLALAFEAAIAKVYGQPEPEPEPEPPGDSSRQSP